MVENYCFIHSPTFIQTCRGESPGAADSHSVAIFGNRPVLAYSLKQAHSVVPEYTSTLCTCLCEYHRIPMNSWSQPFISMGLLYEAPGLPRSGNMPNLTAYVASNSSLHGDLQHCQQERKGFGWIYKLIICDYFVSFGKDISKSTTILNTLVTHCTSTCTNSCFIERQKILKTR